MPALRPAQEWTVSGWLNAAEPLTLASLKGRVVYALAFQMLCPGCAAHAVPQALKVRAAFAEDDVAVIGLHTVFEHAEAQGSKEALASFLHEYKIRFPVAIDAAAPDGGVPETMRAYNMQGTPTTILIDRAGNLRLQRFGHVDDLSLGAMIGSLLGEGASD